ncbi:unnamed protein product [Calypogeia fissa]
MSIRMHNSLLRSRITWRRCSNEVEDEASGGLGSPGDLAISTRTDGSNEVEEDVSAGVCRFCLEQDEVKKLESPCYCSGSIKYAHRKCVPSWCMHCQRKYYQPFKDGYHARICQKLCTCCQICQHKCPVCQRHGHFLDYVPSV